MAQPFGRYELLKRIAGGGMGEVYLARQAGFEGFEKLLVVKVLLPNLVEDEEFIKMFLDEARIAARLNHPNVAQIFDLGEVEGVYYIAMEYIHGDDIIRLWKKSRADGKAVPLALAARIIADAAAGLDYAHKAVGADNEPLGLVHRDVSPQNILVTFDGGVKVIDFGIAKAAGRASHTATGILKGKYAYMSPEQASGKAIDHRSDVFALGVVLYEMATSMRLFKRDSEVSTLRAVTDCEVPLPETFNKDVDAALQGIMLKALAREPGDRYPDAQSLRLSLEDWLVQSRQSGSAAHLAAFMQDLYAQRLADERVRGKPFSEGEVSGTAGTGLRLPSSGTERTVPARPKTHSGAGSTPGLASPAASKRNVPLLAGMALAGVLALGIVLAVARSPRDETVPQGGSTARSPAPAGTLTVATRPAGAEVTVNGEIVGITPLEGFALRDGRSAQIEISLVEHVTVRRSVPGVGSTNLDVTLEKQPPPVSQEPPKQEATGVALSFVSQPPGATVQLGDRVLGITPLATKVPRSTEGVSVSFRLAGHRPVTKSLSPNEDQEVSVVLAKVQVVARPPEKDPLDIKTGR
jgi:serine/threonine-protein kinase